MNTEVNELMGSRKKISMQQIADMAGVSKFVVSKTLSGKPGVSESTRQKVLLTAKQLGYYKEQSQLHKSSEHVENETPSPVKTGFILVVMAEDRNQNKQSTYWGRVLEGITKEIQRNQQKMIIITELFELSEIVKMESLLGIISVGYLSTEVMVDLHQCNVPMIIIDHEDPLIAADSIFTDNFSGMFKMTNHCLALGHQHTLFVGDLHFSRSFYDRWLGYSFALEKDSLYSTATPVKRGLFFSYDDSLFNKLKEWVTEAKEKKEAFPTAFICANDDIAHKMIEALAEQGIHVPQDCSVTGFDNLEFSSYIQPPLTTVQVLKELIGSRAVSKLMWRIEHPEFPPEKILISGELIIRTSTTKAKT